MPSNPCCCLKLKDAAVTIGIWSTVYALAQIAVFGWQFSVLAQCQHVTMAQANLQCDYYCPCVGASTARTSAIIEIYSIMQLGIFGWQMAAIKYERDRAANTLLPNYNTYGRYDIPTYYESYWQSPEERYYTWLFVIQILCLITAFFLLFASIMMIYGVHTWSRYLLVPWMVTMCASILTSLAYCIMWWAGDVRDYWLMLTIVEMFGVFLNVYCFVVIAIFHRRMLAELEYYARRRKYDRFSSHQQQRGETPHTIEHELDDSAEEFMTAAQQQRRPPMAGSASAQQFGRRPPAGQFPYQRTPPPPQQFQQQQPQQPDIRPYPYSSPQQQQQQQLQQQQQQQQFYEQPQQRTPMERFQQQQATAIPPPALMMPPLERPPPFCQEPQRPRSALDSRIYPSQYDEFRRRRPSSHRHSRPKCRQCGREHGTGIGGTLGRHHAKCHHCHGHPDHCHCHPSIRHHRKYSCSSLCSIGNFDVSEDEELRRRRRRRSSRRGRAEKPAQIGGIPQWSDQESDLSEFVPSVQSEHNYGNINNLIEEERRHQIQRQRRSSGRRRDGGRGRGEAPLEPTLSRAASQQLFPPPQGISIPQHIVIPPMKAAPDGTLDPQAERQYRINSEITISYDPFGQGGTLRRDGAPLVPPRRHPPPQQQKPQQSLGHMPSSLGQQYSTKGAAVPFSYTSNV